MKNITLSHDTVKQWLEDLEYSDSDKNVIAAIKQALAEPAQETFDLKEQARKGCGNCFYQDCDYPNCLKSKSPPPAAPVQEPVARVSLQWLAEMILSDCGHSSNYTPLLDRVKARIEQWERANSAPTPPAAPTVQEPVGCEGAIVNGRVYADRLEHHYKFECEAGPLHLCNDWVEFRRCFDWLAEHATPPAAQPAPVLEGRDWSLLEATQESLREHMAEIKRLKAAQPAPVQEPFCFVYVENGEEYFAPKGAYVPDNAQPLYTTPPAAQRFFVGLTDEEIMGMYNEPRSDAEMIAFGREVEAELRSKNGY